MHNQEKCVFFPQDRRNKTQEVAGYQSYRLFFLSPICNFRIEKDQ